LAGRRGRGRSQEGGGGAQVSGSVVKDQVVVVSFAVVAVELNPIG